MANTIDKFGLSGIINDYRIEYFFKSIIYPVALSIVLSIVFIVLEVDTYDVIKSTVSMVIDIVPDLLGFLLGGYALLIGFGNQDVLKLITKAKGDTKSVYQSLNAVFSISLLSQFLVLLVAVFVNYLLVSNLESVFNHRLTKYINNIFSFIFMAMIFWSILNIKDMIINIFNFGQIQFLDIKRKSEKEQGDNLQ